MTGKKSAKHLKKGKKLESTKPLTKLSDFHVIKTTSTSTP
jgi:hypothetical protein